MPLVRVPGDVHEPIDLEEIKLHLRIDYEEEDALIEANMKSAREWIERRCEIVIVPQAWEYRTSFFPGTFNFPWAPTAGYGGVFYIDTIGNLVPADPDLYLLIEGDDETPYQLIIDGNVPTDAAERPDAVRIRFSTGYPYGDGSPPDYGSNVPEALKQAIRLLTAHYFENRAEVTLTPTRMEIVQIPAGVLEVISPYIKPRL